MTCISRSARELALVALTVASTLLIGCGPPPVTMVLDYQVDRATVGEDAKIDMDRLATMINKRLGRMGRARDVGHDHIEVDLYGAVDHVKLTRIDRLVGAAGRLELRIAANLVDHPDLIDKAEASAANQLVENDKLLAEWVRVDVNQFDMLDGLITRTRTNDRVETEVLVVSDTYNVTGDRLSTASAGFEAAGNPAVNFSFNSSATRDFGLLTSENAPDAATGFHRRIGIILDKTLLSAPRLNEPITGGSGQISGGKFTNEDVEFLVGVLHSGSLPCSVRKVAAREVE